MSKDDRTELEARKNNNLLEDKYLETLEEEVETFFETYLANGFPIPGEDAGLTFTDDDSILEDIDFSKGFELEPDPWTVTPPRPPKCECGLGVNTPSKMHYTWCCLYIEEREV